MEPRLIVLERTEKIAGYSREKWESFMPQGSKAPTEIGYVKRGIKVFDIKSVLEINGNLNECIILFYDGEEIIVQGPFSAIYEAWIEAEERADEEDDLILGI